MSVPHIGRAVIELTSAMLGALFRVREDSTIDHGDHTLVLHHRPILDFES